MVLLQGSWEVLLVACREGLTNGGLAGMFWASIWTFAGMTPVVLSLAEMVSMAPTSGGQYHWVSEFAPRKWQRLLSYYTGWVSAMSWQAGAASGPYLVGTLLRAVYEDPGLHHRSDGSFWEAGLIIMTVLAVYLCNCYGGSSMPVLQNVLLLLHILGVLIVSITRHVASCSTLGRIADCFDV
jgi:choline transport protein